MLRQTTMPGPRCNIGPAEVARRRRVAVALSIATAIVGVAVVASDVPHPVRLMVWPFAAAAGVTWLQVIRRFCVRFGVGGLENFGRLGQERRVAAGQLAADRRRALELIGEGCLLGLLVTLAVVAIPT